MVWYWIWVLETERFLVVWTQRSYLTSLCIERGLMVPTWEGRHENYMKAQQVYEEGENDSLCQWLAFMTYNREEKYSLEIPLRSI